METRKVIHVITSQKSHYSDRQILWKSVDMCWHYSKQQSGSFPRHIITADQLGEQRTFEHKTKAHKPR